MQLRDQRILEHLALHRLSVRELLDELFFDGKKGGCANVVKRLMNKQGWVTSTPFPEGNNRTYYTLTEEGASALGVASSRCGLSPQLLEPARAALWLAHQSPRAGHLVRLTPEDLKQLFPDASIAGEHLVDVSRGWVLRVYAPAPKANKKKVHDGIKRNIGPGASLHEDPLLRSWAASGNYRLAVVVRRSAFKNDLKAWFKAEGLNALCYADEGWPCG